jgi:hypothetical protein
MEMEKQRGNKNHQQLVRYQSRRDVMAVPG